VILLSDKEILKALVDSVFWADRMVKADLIEGLISSENDYTSNLTCTIRRQINARACSRLKATSHVLKPRDERQTGCDACIILGNGRQFKVCLFEAKWPRLKAQNNYSWDYVSEGESHFSEQIKKQSHLPQGFVVWEMFYCEYPVGQQPAWMPRTTSACVFHRDAYAEMKVRNNSTRWTNQELAGLLTGRVMQIDQIVKAVCLCQEGDPFIGDNYLGVFDRFSPPSEVLVIEFSE
jgi:hypothetical protein